MVTDPQSIEKQSFKIIEQELTVPLEEEHKHTIIRIIHTTADFEYASLIEISEHALEQGARAILGGCRIYADTNMVQAGINKKILSGNNSSVYTLVADSEVAAEAKERGVTRSIVAMERAVQDMDTKIFVIGNAPTALMALKKCMDNGTVCPELVIAVPVGFVGAVESKEELRDCDVPYIITRGRKGGSTVAVAIVNSILYQLDRYHG